MRLALALTLLIGAFMVRAVVGSDVTTATAFNVKSITVDLPDGGQSYLATMMAVGSRPDKGPIQAPAGWTKLIQILHGARFFGPVNGASSVTFTSSTLITAWWVVIKSYDVTTYGETVGDTACSKSGDPICDGAPGTPGKLKMPAIDSQAGQIVSALWAAHDNAGGINLPPGESVVATILIDKHGVYVVSEHVAEGPEGPVTATTDNPQFIRAILERTALGG